MSAVNIIKSSDDIVRVLRQGKRFSSHCVAVYIVKTPPQRDQSGRVAFIAGKKHGNAVWRNRSKRVLRAAWRMVDFDLTGFDVLLIASKTTSSEGACAVADSLASIFKRVGKMS